MRLWLVIYILGEIAAVLGPLPPDYDACQKMAEAQIIIEPDAAAKQGIGTADVRVECEWSTSRPDIGG